MTCQHTMTLGVYLLGALDPSERSEFESHLAYCDICRGELVRLAPLPGLLNQITQDDFAEERPPAGHEGTIATRVPVQSQPITEPVPIPRAMTQAMTPALPPVTDDTPRPRARPAGELAPRRYWQVAAAAAAVVVLAVGGVFGWRAIEAASPPVAQGVTWSASTEDGAAHADARLVDHEWGTEIQARVEGLPPGKKCYLVVYDHYGNREVAGWWGTDHDPNVEIPASTSIQRSKISRLEFKLDEETVALTIQAPG